MSNSTALALITASFLPAFFCFHYITKLANDVAMEIETGVVRGIPISSGYRRIMLYQIWSGYGPRVSDRFALSNRGYHVWEGCGEAEHEPEECPHRKKPRTQVAKRRDRGIVEDLRNRMFPMATISKNPMRNRAYGSQLVKSMNQRSFVDTGTPLTTRGASRHPGH